MASGNKSLGRFKLTGIPPAPRGIPQIQVSLDIDANGILQVTARDKTTGREQGITVQGASTLSDSEINRMIKDAEQFANEDRARKDKIAKRNNAKSLADQAQRRLKEVTLDFGSQFASYYRRRIDDLCEEIADALAKNDERVLDRAEADLQDALYELNREVRLQYDDEEDNGFLDTLKDVFLGEDDDQLRSTDDYSYDVNRDRYNDPYGYNNSYNNAPSQGNYGGYNQPRSNGYQDNYNRDNYNGGGRQDPYQDNYSDRNRGSYQEPYQDPRSARNSNQGGYQERDNSPRNSNRDSRGEGNYSGNMPNGGRSGNNWRQSGNDSIDRRYYSNRDRSRSIPYQNDWDEEDDEWF